MSRAPFCFALLSLTACNVFDESLEKRIGAENSGPRECKDHSDCADRPEPSACVLPEGRCVQLGSEDCSVTVGDLTAPNALVLGSMFSTTGAQMATNLPRQQSAMLAIEEINAVGGVPFHGSKRPLVLVSCDEVANLDRAATHLINELKVPAIVGPNVSQDVITVSNKYSVAGDTVLVSPTAVASSIGDLVDDDLTWVVVPSDEARAPLMQQQIQQLEEQLKDERPGEPVKLSIIYRNDALGAGTRASLNSQTINDQNLSDALADKTATIEPYGATDAAGQAAIVDRQLTFAPDIIVMAGLAEAITQIMNPLEDRWSGAKRPYYILIDSLKVPELLTAAAGDEDLRKRVRGTGIVPTASSTSVFDAFTVDYQVRYPGAATSISGMGPSYDSAYAIALAISSIPAASDDQVVTGTDIAKGLRKLGGPGSEVVLQSNRVLAAFSQLSSGKTIQAVGTFAPLAFDEKGAASGGRVEIWCIAKGMPARYDHSGLYYDIDTQRFDGSYEQCE